MKIAIYLRNLESTDWWAQTVLELSVPTIYCDARMEQMGKKKREEGGSSLT